MKLHLSLLLISLVLISACTNTNKPIDQDIITVSIAPQKYFVDAISNAKLKVNVFVPAGSSPASYEPSPRQMIELQNSNTFIQMGGLGFEMAWLPKIQEQNKDLKIYSANKGISLVNDEEHGKNPHVWISAKQCKHIAQNTYNALVATFPENKGVYAKNLVKLNAKIDSIDQMYRSQLGALVNKNFMIFHPALHYLAHDYGLTQMAIEEHGKEPSPNHLIEIIKQAKEHNVKVIFIQKEFDMENAQVIAKQTGAKIVQINPLDYNWEQQQLMLLKQLVESLK